MGRGKTIKKTNKEIPDKVFTDMETIRYSLFILH